MRVICASSDYEQLAAICDRVIVFGRGRIVRELAGSELTKERIVEQCYAAMAGEAAWESSRDRAQRPRRSRPPPPPEYRPLADAPTRLRALRAAARLGVVVVVFGILRPDTFLTTSNFTTIFGSQAILVVLTLALLAPLTAGDYDLSVAATMTLAAMVLAILNVNHGWSIWASIVAALAVGAGRGARQRRARRAARTSTR